MSVDDSIASPLTREDLEVFKESVTSRPPLLPDFKICSARQAYKFKLDMKTLSPEEDYAALREAALDLLEERPDAQLMKIVCRLANCQRDQYDVIRQEARQLLTEMEEKAKDAAKSRFGSDSDPLRQPEEGSDSD